MLYPLGSKQAKAGRTDEAVFRLFSNAYKSVRDACGANARRMVDDYLKALREVQDCKGERPDIEEIANRNSSGLRRNREQRRRLRQRSPQDCLTAMFDMSLIGHS